MIRWRTEAPNSRSIRQIQAFEGRPISQGADVNRLRAEYRTHIADEVAVQAIAFEVLEVKRVAIALIIEIDVDALGEQVDIHDGRDAMRLEEFYRLPG